MVESDQKGPDIMSDEIYAAIRNMKNGKSTGIDEIPAELLKMLEGEALKRIAEICIVIYNTGIWPEDFATTVTIPLPKKANAVEFTDYWTISLISHASKIFTKDYK